jgi:hypothetical protein
MTDAIVAVVGTLIVALLAFLTALAARSAARQTQLEHRIKALEQRDRHSWLYIRSLIDYAYRHSDTMKYPLPEPPAGWLDDVQEE